MATSITTQADVLTFANVTDNELSRLETERMRKDNWASLHTQAWTRVKQMLGQRLPTVTESDLDDSTELKEATVYLVLYLAYCSPELGEQGEKRARYWWKRYRRTFAEVELTIGGSTWPAEDYSNMRSLRG